MKEISFPTSTNISALISFQSTCECWEFSLLKDLKFGCKKNEWNLFHFSQYKLSDGSIAKIKYSSYFKVAHCHHNAKGSAVAYEWLYVQDTSKTSADLLAVWCLEGSTGNKSRSVYLRHFQIFPMLHTDTAVGTHHLSTVSLVDLDCFPLINAVLKIVAATDFIAIAMLSLPYKLGILSVFGFTYLLCQSVEDCVV